MPCAFAAKLSQNHSAACHRRARNQASVRQRSCSRCFIPLKIERERLSNLLLKHSSIFNGMKTGYANAAGRCFISSASMGGREVILAQFGSETQYIFDDAERMMRWGLAQNGLFRLAY